MKKYALAWLFTAGCCVALAAQDRRYENAPQSPRSFAYLHNDQLIAYDPVARRVAWWNRDFGFMQTVEAREIHDGPDRVTVTSTCTWGKKRCAFVLVMSGWRVSEHGVRPNRFTLTVATGKNRGAAFDEAMP